MIQLWALPNSGLASGADLRALLDRYAPEHSSDIKVRIVNRQTMWKMLFRYQRTPETEEFPDIVEIPHYWTPLFAGMEILAYLGEAGVEFDASRWIGPLAEHCMHRRKRQACSLPWLMDVSALHYRVDHLREVASDPDKLLSDWDGLIMACRLLMDKRRGVRGYAPIENSNLRGTVTVRDILPSIWNNGGSLFSADNSRSALSREETLRGLEQYLDLFISGYMPLLQEKGSRGTMLDGRASMCISRRQADAFFLDDGADQFSVKTVSIPGGIFGSHSFLSSYNLAVLKHSNNAARATRIISQLCENEAAMAYCRAVSAFPCSMTAFEQFIFSSPQRVRTYAAIVGDAGTVPAFSVTGTYLEIVDGALESLCHKIAQGRYSHRVMQEKMERVSKEMDYLISLYGG